MVRSDEHDRAGLESSQIDIGRRKLMGAGASALLAATAGCSGSEDNNQDEQGTDDGTDDGETDDTGTEDSESNGDSATITGATLRFPDEFNWNIQGSGEVPDHPIQAFVYGSFAVRDAAGEYRMILGEDWDVPSSISSGDEVTMTLKEGLTYHDGTEFNAERLADDIAVRIGMDDFSTRHFSEVEVVDDLTVSLTASENVAQGIVKDGLSGVSGYLGTDRIDDLPDRFREAGEDELEEIQAELTQQTWDEPNGVGPWQYESASSDRLLLTRFDGFPNATDIPQMEMRYVGDSKQQAVSTGQLDYAREREGWMLDDSNLPSDDHEPEVRNFVDEQGWTIEFDLRHDIWSNRNVRQAIAHVVDRNSTVQDQLPANATQEHRDMVREKSAPSSLALLKDDQEERFLGDLRDQFPTYSGMNEERAQELLENEGFSRENGDWYTPDGDRWETSIRAGPVFQPWARSVSNQLIRFGIECEVDTMEGGAFWDAQFSDQEFEMTIGIWGPADWHVFNNYQRINGLSRSITHAEAAYGVDVENEDEQHIQIELPPIGEMDGPTETFDATEAVAELEQIAEEDATEVVQQLAWYNTYNVQQLPLNITAIFNCITHDDWSWPSQDSAANKGLEGSSGAVAWMLGEVNQS